jgi:hypothetical protein
LKKLKKEVQMTKDILLRRYEVAYGKSNRLFQRNDGSKYIKFHNGKTFECPPDTARTLELTFRQGSFLFELSDAVTAADVLLANKNLISVKVIDGGAND